MQQSAQSIEVHRNLRLLSTIDIIIDIECQIEQLRAELTGIFLTAEERVAALADITQLPKAMTDIALNTLRDNRRRCLRQQPAIILLSIKARWVRYGAASRQPPSVPSAKAMGTTPATHRCHLRCCPGSQRSLVECAGERIGIRRRFRTSRWFGGLCSWTFLLRTRTFRCRRLTLLSQFGIARLSG
jgi:hypothetical protein